MTRDRTLDIVSDKDAKQKVSDINIVGNTDLWQLLAKASSKDQDWMKSTKAIEIPGLGVLIQVSTQQGDNVAEALEFVPGAAVVSYLNDDNKEVYALAVANVE